MSDSSTGQVAHLSTWREEDASRVGGKAMGLMRMQQRGYPVPEAFCIVTDAYRQHVAGREVRRQLERTIARLPAWSPRARRRRLRALRRRIIESPLSDGLHAEVERCYLELHSPEVAVRSSGTFEDQPAMSGAGLHDTFLDVTDLDTCLTAVKRCWASL